MIIGVFCDRQFIACVHTDNDNTRNWSILRCDFSRWHHDSYTLWFLVHKIQREILLDYLIDRGKFSYSDKKRVIGYGIWMISSDDVIILYHKFS